MDCQDRGTGAPQRRILTPHRACVKIKFSHLDTFEGSIAHDGAPSSWCLSRAAIKFILL
jgi:hypothetical protein